MVAKVALVVVMAGVALMFLGAWLGEPVEETPEDVMEKILRRQPDPLVSRETLGWISYWAGASLVIGGGLVLLFYGVRKSFLTDGACHE